MTSPSVLRTHNETRAVAGRLLAAVDGYNRAMDDFTASLSRSQLRMCRGEDGQVAFANHYQGVRLSC